MRLTIITPSLNQAKYLERAIRSVLEQGWSDLEYLVVDAGSTDGSVQIIERYANRVAWWVSEPDAGQTDALNKALRRATGDVVAYLNSDDYYLPGAFATAVAALERSGASWTVGSCRFVDETSGRTHVWRPQPPPRSRPVWLLAPWGVPQPSSFWRRDLFTRHGPFRTDMHYAFDTEHGLRLALNGELPKIIDDELAVRYLHEAAKSSDCEPFQRERRELVALFATQLTRRERLELAVRDQIARLIG